MQEAEEQVVVLPLTPVTGALMVDSILYEHTKVYKYISAASAAASI